MGDRVQRGADTSAIPVALDVIPPAVLSLVNVRFVAGVDPVFAGLHGWLDASFGRSYRYMAHFCAPEHLFGPRAVRVPTVMLPKGVEPWVVTHEIGHALDFALDCKVPRPEPVSEYAATNGLEAFAEAFTAWLHPEIYPWAAPILARDPILTFFEEIARS